MKVSEQYELPLDLPAIEPIRKKREQVQTSDGSIPVTFSIGRTIDTNHWGNGELEEYLTELEAANNPLRGKKKYPIKGINELKISYFDTSDLLAAIERAGSKGAYRNFGTNFEQTKRTMQELNSSFYAFLADSRYVQTAIEDRMFAYGVDSRDVPSRSLVDVRPEAKDYKWAAAPVRLGGRVLVLEQGDFVHLALDLGPNDFLKEECQAVREHYKTVHGLVLPDTDTWRDGTTVQRRPHSVIATIAGQIFFDQAPDISSPPWQASFHAPEIDARIS